MYSFQVFAVSAFGSIARCVILQVLILMATGNCTLHADLLVETFLCPASIRF